MTLDVKPLKNWIYIKITKEKTIGGIVVPDRAQDERHVCDVLVVGPEVKKVKAGDEIVVIGAATIRYQGLGLPSDEIRSFIQEDNVIAVVKERK